MSSRCGDVHDTRGLHHLRQALTEQSQPYCNAVLLLLIQTRLRQVCAGHCQRVEDMLNIVGA